jgi:hypothetical protein
MPLLGVLERGILNRRASPQPLLVECSEEGAAGELEARRRTRRDPQAYGRGLLVSLLPLAGGWRGCGGHPSGPRVQEAHEDLPWLSCGWDGGRLRTNPRLILDFDIPAGIMKARAEPHSRAVCILGYLNARTRRRPSARRHPIPPPSRSRSPPPTSTSRPAPSGEMCTKLSTCPPSSVQPPTHLNPPRQARELGQEFNGAWADPATATTIRRAIRDLRHFLALPHAKDSMFELKCSDRS